MHLLDANAFIEAKNTYYSFTMAPGFWTWLLRAHDAGALGSIVAVRAELLQQNDELSTWVTTEVPPTFWLPEDPGTVDALRAVAQWAMSRHHAYTDAARATFLASADYRLVAAGKAGGHVVVTREQHAPESKRSIKLPDACVANGVAVTDPFSLYTAAGLRLR